VDKYDVYLCNVVPYVDISDTNLCLCNIFDNGVWSFNGLYTQLSPFYQDCIRGFTFDHDTDDKLIWSDTYNGEYSANLVYKGLDRHLHQHVTPIICWNWN
jgi:hypothetical protein